jgi:hypothetical protein
MMMQAKKRSVNAPSSQGSRSNKDREERLSLLGYDKGTSSSSAAMTTTTMSPPTSGNSTTLSFRKERRKAAQSSSDDAEEERVSLMGPPKKMMNSRNDNNNPSGGLSRFRKKHPLRGLVKGNKNSPPWTVNRTMKYVALMVISACMTFLLLRKQSKAVQWEDYKNILQPDEGKETRCYVSFWKYIVYSPVTFGFGICLGAGATASAVVVVVCVCFIQNRQLSDLIRLISYF